MARGHGSKASLKWGANTVPGTTEISDVGVGDVPVADTTAMGDTAASKVPGIYDGGSFTFSGLADVAAAEIAALAADAKAGTTRAFEVAFGGGGKVTGNGYVTKFVHSASFGGAVLYSGTIAVSGAVTHV